MANFLKQVMQPVPFTVTPDTPMGEAIALMGRYGLGYAVVLEQHQVRGLVAEADVVRWMALGGDGAYGAIAQVMPENNTIYPVTEDEEDIELFERMQRDRILYLPVVDATGMLMGVVTLWDVVQALNLGEMHQRVEQLERSLQDCASELKNECHQRQESDRQRYLVEEQLATAQAERQRMEETLKRNEAQNRAVLSAIPDLLCILGSDGTFQEVIRESTTLNNVIHDLPDDINPIGQPMTHVLPPELAERQGMAVQRAIATGQVQSYEQNIFVAGQLQHEDVRISPIDDNSVLLMIRDIGDRKRSELERQKAEAALRESEARFQEIAHTIDQKFFIRCAKTQDFLYVSPGYETLYGRSVQSLYENPDSWLDAVHPDDQIRIRQAVKEQFSQDSSSREFRIIHADGTVRWIATHVKTIRDEAGNPDRIIGLAEDITDRKQIEDERKQSEAAITGQKEFLQSIINAIPSSVFVKDKNGQFVLANKASADVYGVLEADLIGLRDVDLNPSTEQVEQFLALNQHVMETRQTCISDDQAIAHPQQGLRWYQTTVSPWIDSNGAVLGIIGNCIDITERKQLELDLQESKEKLNDILASVGASIGYFRLYLDGRWETLYHSQGCEDVFGYAPGDFLAEVWLANVVEEDMRTILNPALEAIQNGQPTTVEYRFRHPCGGIRWISDTLTSRWDAAQQCWIVTAVGIDVSDRKRIEIEHRVIEEALRQENQFRSQIIDQMAEGLCVFYPVMDYPYIQFSVWNQRMTDITGYTQDEINANGWCQQLYCNGAVQARVMEYMANLGRSHDLRGEEWVITRSDGEQRMISVSTTLLDTVVGISQVLAVIEDVSDRKRAEAEVETQRKLLRQVIDSIPSLIFARDRNGRFLIVNQSAAAIHGVTPEDLIGRLEHEINPLVSEEWTRQMIDVNHQIMNSGQTQFIPEEPLVLVTGETRWYQTNLIPFVDSRGNTLGIIGTSVDISDRKQIQQSLQTSLREKEVLLSEVHHRVKNNLQVIISLLNLQALRIDDSFARQTLENSGDRVYAMALVHEKLYRTQHFEGISLSDYIHDVVDHLVQTYESPDRRVVVKYTLEDAIHLPLAQAMQFSLILNELITNALKYGDASCDGQQPLYVELRRVSVEEVLFSVGNDGRSLSADFSLATPHQSMGLRLVQVLAEQLNGTIHLEVGEIVWFTLQFAINQSSTY